MAEKCSSLLAIIYLCLSLCISSAQSLREQVIEVTKSQLGVYEWSKNSSPEIDRYNYLAGCPIRSPWCGAFAFVVYDSCGVKTPLFPCRAANWFPKDKIVEQDGVYVASTYGLYSYSEKRIYHVGVVEAIDEDNFVNISGNWTDSVKRTRYPITKYTYFSDWIDDIPQWYTVKQGDTLYAISNRFKVDLDDILEMNNLESYRIQIGQRIRLSE